MMMKKKKKKEVGMDDMLTISLNKTGTTSITMEECMVCSVSPRIKFLDLLFALDTLQSHHHLPCQAMNKTVAKFEKDIINYHCCFQLP